MDNHRHLLLVNRSIEEHVIPMTYALESSAINRLHFSGTGFWYVCHAYLGLDSSGTRFWRRLEHCSIPSQKLACTSLKRWLVIGRW